MNILLTGASGSIGKTLINTTPSNFQIYTLGRSSVQKENVTHLEVDLSKEWDTNILPNDIDVIIHLAQSENFRLFPDKAIDVYTVNTISTLKLADFAVKNGINKFVYASSGGIYGNRDTGFGEEDEIPVNDLGFYLGSKLSSEIILDSYKNIIDIQLLRFFFVYGPDQNESMLIPRLINNVLNGKTINLQGEEGLKINPIHVDDAVNAILASLKLEKSNKLNIGGSEELSLKDITVLIGKQLGVKPKYSYIDSEPNNLIGDISKLKKIGYFPQISFEEGINLLINNVK